ncbi:unnamed protein product [Urochloa humidicola]
MAARVAYRNDTMLLSVDLQIGDAPYHVSTNVDLRDSLPDTVAVGFSAATGDFVELHQLLSWSFDSDLEASTPPTPRTVNESAAPAPQAHDGAANKHHVRPEILALVTVSGLLCLVVLLLIACTFKMVSQWCQKQAREKLGHGPRRYQYSELVKATNKFDQQRKLGIGGSSEVYLGNDQGRQVAVKKLLSIGTTDEESQRTRRREFEAEVDIISRLRHKNLVRLFGWCDSSNGLLLVYEHISQGSLDKHLYSTERSLSWNDRYRIILGLGKALCYLHGKHSGTKYVVHGDIKPSNIMLDEELNAKLGDFGVARLVDYRATARTTEKVMGTKGYIEPEFEQFGKRSVESDVYSFGIVLMEIVTGHGPLRPPLPSWVWDLYGQNKVLEAASATLRSESNDWQMERVLIVGLWCTLPARSERPPIAHAMHVLEHADAPLPILTPGHIITSQNSLGDSESPEHRRVTSPLLGSLSLVPSQMYSNVAPACTAGEQGYGNAMKTAVTPSDRGHSSSAGNSTSYTT